MAVTVTAVFAGGQKLFWGVDEAVTEAEMSDNLVFQCDPLLVAHTAPADGGVETEHIKAGKKKTVRCETVPHVQ